MVVTENNIIVLNRVSWYSVVAVQENNELQVSAFHFSVISILVGKLVML